MEKGGRDGIPISIEELNKLKEVADRARKNVIRMQFYDQSIHVGSSLSSIEILTALELKILRDSNDPVNKDWLILSKGHAAPALYAVLHEKGLIKEEELWKIQDISGLLQGHPETFIPGVDMSTGSLGQGLSFGIGVATGIKMAKGTGRVFVIMGDGEQDEGEVWEAMTHAVARNLDNLVAIIEMNGFQLDESTKNVKPKEFLPEVWRAVGWRVFNCDGHDIASVISTVGEALKTGKPAVIFAETKRGKGFTPIENTKRQRTVPDVARQFLLNS
ncbi:1-deoxy-D-xylulose-5-phosphate synthase [Metallosphaera sp. J1]|uniref:transketolase n=1 Tax=Metallosphaera javensis (ex Hofmann et al. 2022) TaxID=99938 RepID=UPI001EE14BFB|nr:transketolase [Metallosphaera javensis (ex Hofmann et al. 2022)]MCG3109731.1 1-deoxy-D-xylulose-5-phosphate synthase [Metallosphaera javensis (ex Hofmann et al. 2022)]